MLLSVFLRQNVQAKPGILRQLSRISIATGAVGALVILIVWAGENYRTEKQTTEENPKGQVTKVTKEVRTGKTGWDYLELFGAVAVPLVLGVGGFWLNQQEQRRAEAREDQEQKRVEETLREEALQTYLDRISELLLNNNLGKLNQENNPARNIARARTLTVLGRLGEDGERKKVILRFLYEAALLKQPESVVNLSGANLHRVNLYASDLRGANLRGARLHEANLCRAILFEADLSRASLFKADLSGVLLHKANLHRAILRHAILNGATLRGADLSGADLQGAAVGVSIADLSGANLQGALLRGADMYKVDLSGATYNDSTSFPNNFDPIKAGMQKLD